MLRSNRVRSFVTGISILMLPACMPSIAEIPRSQPIQKSTWAASHCTALNEYEALAAMSEKELKQEEQMLRENMKTARSDCDQLTLAMLLSMPAVGVNNEEESEQIFKDILKQEQFLSAQERQIVQILLEQAQRRIKMRSELKILKNQLKKERVASLKLLENLADTESKLNQLKNIEKDINKQEQEISTPSTDKIPHDAK